MAEKLTHLIGEFVVENAKITQEKLSIEPLIADEKQKSLSLLPLLKDKQYLGVLRSLNLALAKQKIKESVTNDNLISQAVNSIQELDKVINILSKRLREWYSLTNPEFSRSIDHNEKFAQLVVEKSREQLLKEAGYSESMGADLHTTDYGYIQTLAKQITGLCSYRDKTKAYLEALMKQYCPNLQAVAGTVIGARLLEHAGTLRRLVMMPASTIQIIGAEKALFRHIKSGSRPPKHGFLLEHPYVQGAKRDKRGKHARTLADKISLAVKMDFFKGKFIGDKLKGELK